MTKKNFGIIGYGRFGKLWAEKLAEFGTVTVFDKKFKKGVSLEQVARANILFLAVPISNFKKLCLELPPLLSPETIVVDTCSVKIYPAKIMSEAFPKDQPYAGTHPLFGPDSVARLGFKGRKLVFCPLNLNKKQKQELLNLFTKLQLKVIETNPVDHDRQLARSQALVHFLGRALADLHLENQEISTPDYESLLQINSLVNNDTQQLFLDMQTFNPYTSTMRSTLLKSLEELNKKINSTPTILKAGKRSSPAI